MTGNTNMEQQSSHTSIPTILRKKANRQHSPTMNQQPLHSNNCYSYSNVLSNNQPIVLSQTPNAVFSSLSPTSLVPSCLSFPHSLNNTINPPNWRQQPPISSTNYNCDNSNNMFQAANIDQQQISFQINMLEDRPPLTQNKNSNLMNSSSSSFNSFSSTNSSSFNTNSSSSTQNYEITIVSTSEYKQLLKLDIESLFLDPCNLLSTTNVTTQQHDDDQQLLESSSDNNCRMISTNITPPPPPPSTPTPTQQGRRFRFSCIDREVSNTTNAEPTLKKQLNNHNHSTRSSATSTGGGDVPEGGEESNVDCCLLEIKEFKEWFQTRAPDNIIISCNPSFTFNTFHKPLGATHSVFVNDAILVHIPQFNSFRMEKMFCKQVQLQLRSYLVSSVTETEEVINNISQLDHLTCLEFYEDLTDGRLQSSDSECPNQLNGPPQQQSRSFTLRVPIKRDNTSKRGKRKEKINAVIELQSSSSPPPPSQPQLPPSQNGMHCCQSAATTDDCFSNDNTSPIVDDCTSSPGKKKKGESAPKKIIFLLLIDRTSGDILYRSDLMWQRSKTKREMDQKRPEGEEKKKRKKEPKKKTTKSKKKKKKE